MVDEYRPIADKIMNTGTHRLEHARKFLLAHWKDNTDAELAKYLKMSLLSVRRLRYRLGLIRNSK